MFKDNELNEKLIGFVNLGDIGSASQLIKSNRENITSQLAVKHFFFRNYKKGDNNWFNFWKELSFSQEGITKKHQSYLLKHSISYSIDKQDLSMLLEIIKHSKQPEIKKIAGLLARSAISDTNFAISILSKIKDNKLKSILYENLVKDGVNINNGLLLQDLKKLDNGKILHFENIVKSMNLNSGEEQILSELMNRNKENLIYINKKMRAFVNGFGNIDYDAGLLAIAERQNRKSYDYNPTLININEETVEEEKVDEFAVVAEFEKYLNTLKDAHLPLTERFILASSHWTSGEIHIDENGEAKILFIDSLGSYNRQGERELYDTTEYAIKCFARVFPKSQVFISREKRQNAAQGCSVYALDDTAHLFRLHLEDSYNETKLWGYLKDTLSDTTTKRFTIENKNGNLVVVSACNLPLSLMRTMQSEKLLTKAIPGRTKSEQIAPINKKQETAYQSSLKFFKQNPNSNKRQNTRLSYKLGNLKNYAINFLLEKQPSETERLMKEATIEGFKERINKTPPKSVFSFKQ